MKKHRDGPNGNVTTVHTSSSVTKAIVNTEDVKPPNSSLNRKSQRVKLSLFGFFLSESMAIKEDNWSSKKIKLK